MVRRPRTRRLLLQRHPHQANNAASDPAGIAFVGSPRVRTSLTADGWCRLSTAGIEKLFDLMLDLRLGSIKLVVARIVVALVIDRPWSDFGVFSSIDFDR